MPWIERIQVDGGFLDGLDLELTPGLNVIIGARGTGKTSLLELLRFVLGAPAFTEQAANLSENQVRAVLDRGRVRLTVRLDDGEVIAASRTLNSEPQPLLNVTVLAQNEIEAVGASASGRLHLIDRFVLASDHAARLRRLRAELAAIAKQVDSAASELDQLRAQWAQSAGASDQLGNYFAIRS